VQKQHSVPTLAKLSVTSIREAVVPRQFELLRGMDEVLGNKGGLRQLLLFRKGPLSNSLQINAATRAAFAR